MPKEHILPAWHCIGCKECKPRDPALRDMLVQQVQTCELTDSVTSALSGSVRPHGLQSARLLCLLSHGKCPIIGGYAVPRKQCLILEDSGKIIPKGQMGKDLRKNQSLPGERRQRPGPGEMGTDQDMLRQEGH